MGSSPPVAKTPEKLAYARHLRSEPARTISSIARLVLPPRMTAITPGEL